MNRKQERVLLLANVLILAIAALFCHFQEPKITPVYSGAPEPTAFAYSYEPGPLSPDGVIAFFSKSKFRQGTSDNLLTDFFHQRLRQAIVKEASKHNYQVVTYPWSGGDGLTEASKIKRLIEEEPIINNLPLKGVVVTPIDSFAYSSAVYAQSSIGDDIPIVTVDTPLDLDDRGYEQILAHVSVDNKAIAKQVASKALAAAASTGNLTGDVILIMGPTLQQNSNLRLQGFSEAIQDVEQGLSRRLRVVVVANGDWSLSFGRETLNWYRKLRPFDQVSVILAANDNMALGALVELSSRGNTLPIVVGIDGTASAKAAISRGTLFATIEQPAEELGRVAVQQIIDYLDNGSEPDSKIVTIPSDGIISR